MLMRPIFPDFLIG